MPDQARFLDFMDMIDGGGAGRMGDKFEGGGIFSALANLVATPYGSEDPARAARRDAVYRSAGLLSAEQEPAPAPTATPTVRRTKPTRNELMSARAAEMERQRGLQQDVYDPRNQQGASGFRNPTSGYPNMNMPAIAGYTTPAAPASGYPNMSMPAIAGYTTPASAMRQPAGTPTAPYEQTGAVTDVRFGAPATPSPMLDQRQQAPSPDETRALQAISDNNMMSQFMNLPPYQQRAMIDTMLQRGY